MFTASNSLSFIRAPLAFLFLFDSPALRISAVILAMLTDSIDGYLARRSQSTSKLGAILDPATDKFFVYFALATFFLEGKLLFWQMLTMLSRDFFLCLYILFIIAKGQWNTLHFQAIRWGKVATALQFVVLIGLSLNFQFPWAIFASFVAMGWLAFLELFQRRTSTIGY